jgi:hypothetical protein
MRSRQMANGSDAPRDGAVRVRGRLVRWIFRATPAMKKLALLTIVLFATILGAWRLFDAETARSSANLLALNLPVVPAVAQTDTTNAPAAAQDSPAAAPAKHKITITFDYDFSRTPACSATVASKCVNAFRVYDISGGAEKAFKLLSIPAPTNAAGAVKGISGTTPLHVFESGKQLISVTAVDAKGVESDRNVATVWVVIP